MLRLPAEDADAKEAAALVDTLPPAHLKLGAEVFTRRCAGCHGETGDGQGEAAAFLQPKPRDYRKGVFKFMSTPYGDKPVRNDLIRIVLQGSKGTSMPSFKFLADDELQAVVDYVIVLSHRGETEETLASIATNDYEPEDEIDAEDIERSLKRVRSKWLDAEYAQVRPLTSQPKVTNDTILAGRKAFLSRGCSKCHGTDAKGQIAWLSPAYIAAQEAKPEAEREKINFDAWNHPAPAADLTAGMLHGGRRPIDIYRRIYSGINGTPMPGFAAAFSQEPDTIWHLTHYVLSVVDGKDIPGLADVQPDPLPEETLGESPSPQPDAAQ
jgi:mono/diheme cytochrome c family protein